MNPAVLPYLRCPICRLPLTTGTGTAAAPRTLRCPTGHDFDVARQGYVNLATGRQRHPGDTPEMVAARHTFLRAGHFEFISTQLAEAAAAAVSGQHRGAGGHLVVDAGAGTGEHLSAVLDALPDECAGLALDVSKAALRWAARAHHRLGAARCDTWRPLPLADAAASVVLNVFAPRNPAEFRRVLRPTGVLVMVTPTVDHLAELIGPLGLLRVDPDKEDRVAAALDGHFVGDRQVTVGRTLLMHRNDVAALVAMGPTAWHLDPQRLADRLDTLAEPFSVTASIRLTVCRPR